MDHERIQHDWRATASRAGFLPFEVVDPMPSSSSLAGLGGGSEGQLHLGIAHIIEGHEIYIETDVGAVRPDEASEDRRTVIDAVERALDEQLAFPLTLHLRFEVRTADILVDGATMQFRGIVSSAVDDWRFCAETSDGTSVSIKGKGDSMPTAIRRRTDLEIEGLIAAN